MTVFEFRTQAGIAPLTVAARAAQILPSNCSTRSKESKNERIFDDASVAQRVELGDVEFHDAPVVALFQLHPQDHRGGVAFDGHEFDLIFAAEITLLLDLDRFRRPSLAALVAEMGKQLHRRVDDGVDLIVEAFQRAQHVAGIERRKILLHALAGLVLRP